MGIFRLDAGGRLPMKVNRMKLIVPFLLLLAGPAQGAGAPGEEYYFAIEINGIVCGYSKFMPSPFVQDGRKMLLLKHTILMRLTALGSQVESRLGLTYHIDPATGRFVYHDSTIEQGGMRMVSKIRIEGGKAYVTGSDASPEQVVPLPLDVVLANTLYIRTSWRIL